MPNVHLNPKGTKPPDLDEPCRSCPKYRETEAELHPDRKAILGNPNLNVHFRRCEFDPRLANPDLASQCPFSEFVGKPLIVITCDCCGEVMKHLKPDSEELTKRLETKWEDGVTRFDVCQKCRAAGKEPRRQVLILGRPAE